MKMMKNMDFDVKVLLIFCLINAVFTLGIHFDTQDKIEFLSQEIINLEEKKIVLDSVPQAPEVSDFTKLSDNAQSYIDRVAPIRATPTFLVNGVKILGLKPGANYTEIETHFGIDLRDIEEIIFYSSPTCGFCEEAEKSLRRQNLDFIKVCTPIHPGDYDKCDESFVK
jgi:glutaredoxin